MLRQSEKLATLGKLSAGMAHELNNPAAAAQRGAEQLRGAISQLWRVQFELGASSLSQAQVDALATLDQRVAGGAGQPAGLDTLARSNREYEIESWLEDKGVEDAWELAPMLVNMGFDPGSLAGLRRIFTAGQFPKVVASLCSLYTTHALLEEIGHGAGRIAGSVKALKSYTSTWTRRRSRT